MTSVASQLRQKSWRQDHFLVSTDPSKVPINEVIKVFKSDEFQRAQPLPEDAMRDMLDNCLFFALYDTEQAQNTPDNRGESQSFDPKFVGMARCITDFTTVIYITDVWIHPAYRQEGLGTWLIQCVQEVIESMPHLRKSMLATSDWEKGVPFYERVLDMSVREGERGKTRAIMERRGRGNPNFAT